MSRRWNDYRFETQWRVAAPYDQVFDALADLEHYPQWWTAVRAVEGVDEDTARVRIRSRLPYTLTLLLARDTADREAGVLLARLTGDLVGFAAWSLVDDGAVVAAHYSQQVTVRATAMRLLAPVARPLFASNHRQMMRAGLAGLRRRLEPDP